MDRDWRKIAERLKKEYPNIPVSEQLPVFMRGVAEFLPSEEELVKRLQEKRPLRIKLGVDPTSTDLHLGHTVVLQKMRQLQQLGHQIDFLIGSFTAQIGDPSGKNKTRPMLTEEDVMENARTYTDQVFKLLDPEKTCVRYNGEWLKPLTFKEIIKLASQMTVARLIERDDFTKRLKAGAPIGVHELLYPIMQAYDSVMLETDIELGGTDQKYNLLCGRDFLIEANKPPQMVLMMPILTGTDGTEKMSKSLGNAIGISEEPFKIFAKTMSVPDESIVKWFELLTDIPLSELEEIKELFENPNERLGLKMRLARTLTAKYHGFEAGKEAYDKWVREKQERQLPDPETLPKVTISAEDLKDGKLWVVALIDKAHLVDGKGKPITRSEIRRKITEKAVKLNGEVVPSPDLEIAPKTGLIVQFGRQHAFVVDTK